MSAARPASTNREKSARLAVALISACAFIAWTWAAGSPAVALESTIGVGAGTSLAYPAGEGALDAPSHVDSLTHFDIPAYITNDYGPLAGAWRRSEVTAPLRVGTMSNVNAWEPDSVAGVALRNEFSSGTSIGLDIQRGAGLAPGDEPLFLEVGAHYMTPLTDSWQAGLRVSSAFVGEDVGGMFGAGTDGRTGFDRLTSGEGLRNVSVGVGVDYNFARALDFSTFLGYTRSMGESANAADNDYDDNANEFLGGIVVKYKF